MKLDSKSSLEYETSNTKNIPIKSKRESKSFKKYLAKIKPEVDERLKLIIENRLSDIDVIPILLKGKHLRAAITLLIFDSIADKNQDRSSVLDLACAIELAHSASLILDDMLDEDTKRRGLPTLHLTKNHKIAMLNTIDVLSIPYEIAAKYGNEYVKMLAETQRSMVHGVIIELFNNQSSSALKIYDEIIKRKTGKLFSLASDWGYRIANKNNDVSSDSLCFKWRNFSDYGLKCGKTMQIADDISDINLMITDNKQNIFGSEILLLLNSININNLNELADDLFRDIKNHKVDISKVKELLSIEIIQKHIYLVLYNELTNTLKVAEDLEVLNPDFYKIILNAPYEIAEIMLNENKRNDIAEKV